MTKTISTLLTVCFFVCLSFSQSTPLNSDNFKTVSIDSCLSWLRENTYTGKDLDNFHAIGLQTLKRSQKESDITTIAEVHEELVNWHSYNGTFSGDSIIHHAEKALDYYITLDDKKKIADTYRALSIDYINMRELDKSQDVLFKAIALFEALKDEAGLGKAYRTLGALYQVMEDYDKSVAYLNKAIPVLEKAEDFAGVAIAQFGLIQSYGKLGEYEKAYKAADYCMETVRKKVPEETFILVRGHSYRGEVYLEDKKYDEALEDFIKAWEICSAKIGEERCATYETEIGKVYLLQHNYEKALKHLSAGIEAYEKKGTTTLVTQYEDLGKSYEMLGDYKNAIFYKNKAHTNQVNDLKGTIANLEEETIVKYETGKKDEALANQASLLAQKTKTQNLIIAVAALLGLLLLSLLYFFNKNKKATKIIEAKNAENELLLKEIHHRVKNNLEMVKSLISLQSAQMEDSASKDAMIASQNRVQSMGIIHQKLYQGTNLGSIEMKDYFLNLSEGILDTFDAEDKVKIECAMENLDLDVDTAVPIGLIVNELLTNALKYAFPQDKHGAISISLEKTLDNHLKLKVSDNGIGKVEGVAPKGTGFGTQLVRLLTQQLNGKMTERSESGTVIEFDFLIDTAA
ncbi:MAG: histidine kinase dimerization/phosphoacceptor domain -containing protein [Winogradskyella sp.]|uniref:tetratricopeptide repeat-containing sensor histidine kinase n=1 Tax=Winogradskyella sp. TaxID=1883156 RepID=UPI00385C8097